MNEKQLIIKAKIELIYDRYKIIYSWYPQFEWNTLQVDIVDRYKDEKLIYHEVLK